MVSVIIPVYNAEQYADALIKPLTERAAKPEIAVIDSSSADRTVLRIRKDDFNHRGTGNPGVEQAGGEVVVFLTQGAVPCDPGRIDNLTRAPGDTIKAASYGRQLSGEGATPTEKFVRHVNYPDRPLLKRWDDISQLGIKTFFSNACSALRKRKFKKLGGFPEKLIMFGNMFFAARLLQDRYKIACVPGAMVMPSHNYSWLQEFRRYEMAGISLLKALNQKRSVYLLERREGGQARVPGDSLNREWYSGHVIAPVFSASMVWHEYCLIWSDRVQSGACRHRWFGKTVCQDVGALAELKERNKLKNDPRKTRAEKLSEVTYVIDLTDYLLVECMNA